MTLDEQIDEILKAIDFELRPLTVSGNRFADEAVVTGKEQATKAIKALIATQVREAYRKGYNDNARDCYCDSTKVIESLIPHRHLMDDGKSHDIRPDIQDLTKQEEQV